MGIQVGYQHLVGGPKITLGTQGSKTPITEVVSHGVSPVGQPLVAWVAWVPWAW